MEETALLLRDPPREVIDNLADDLIRLAQDLDDVLSETPATVRPSVRSSWL